MRCCVPGCKNDSRQSSKSQGITFHAFPTTVSHRNAWLQALCKKDWHPKDRSSICSQHFSEGDLYFTKNGLRKVRAGAVPLITQEDIINDELSTPGLQACRMCLAMDQKLGSIQHHKLGRVFEWLTGLSVKENDGLPQMLCWECAQRLRNADSFRNRSLKAHMVMLDILNKYDELTEESLSNINRVTNRLISPLSITHNTPNQYNLTIDYDDILEEPNVKTDHRQEEPIDLEMDVKNENIFVDGFTEFDEPMDSRVSDEENDTNFATNNEDFESEDSYPLELTRKKKKKQKEKKESVKKVRKKEVKVPTEPKVDRRRKPFLNQDLNETLFTITDLTVEEQVAEIEKRQESDNYKHSVFKCTECFKGFLDRDAYHGHMTRHTDECGEHRCSICKTHFHHQHALRKHITAHHTQRFSCNHCDYVTTHRQTARLHERWHKGTRYRCPHCPEEFVKFTTYMGHVRIKHPSDFVCSLCGYSFVSAKGIELHKKLKHRSDPGAIPEDGPYCEQCNVRFASIEAHKKHLSVSARHTTKETREANKSNKGRKTKEIREREKTIKKEDEQEDTEDKRVYPSQMRKAEGPIPCEQCGLQLEDSRAYHGHFRRMHPDKNRTKYPSMKSPCMCELCGRIFQSYALLKDHTWVHTNERPFSCTECGKSFRMRQRLVAHRRVHAPQRASHGCRVCGKTFTTHSNLQRHMAIHTGLKPFKCELCGKAFKHASEKRAHVAYVHMKKPWPKRARGKRTQNSPPESNQVEMGMQPVWPTTEPKLTDINILDDKPIYYSLKI